MTKQKEPLIIQGFYLKILYLIHYNEKALNSQRIQGFSIDIQLEI